VEVPDGTHRRLQAVPPEKTAAEGVKLAAEIVQQVSEIPGVAGVHLLVAGNEQAVPDILQSAGVRVTRETDGR
jgi:methylenetetrahydrofolate reductase (NADPH)